MENKIQKTKSKCTALFCFWFKMQRMDEAESILDVIRITTGLEGLDFC